MNTLWLNPIYDSPYLDADYDVVDFRKVAPRYGTNADAKRLFREARKRGIRVVLDLVAGHTSINHPWFLASSRHERNKYSDYYIWSRDMWQAGGNERWIHGYGPRDGSFVTNFFWSQPTLNFGYATPDPSRPWEQPPTAPGPKAVRAELLEIMRFWLDAGCDGFRVDMAPSLIKGPPDSKPLRDLWHDIRSWLDKDYPEAVLISEWSHPTQAIGAGFHIDFMIPVGKASYNHLFGCWSHIGEGHRIPHAFFELHGGGNAVPFFKEYEAHYAATKDSGYIAISTGNHDFTRLRHGRTLAEMRCIHAMLLTIPGVPPTPSSSVKVALMPFRLSVPPLTVTHPQIRALAFPRVSVPAQSMVPPVKVLALLMIRLPAPVFVSVPLPAKVAVPAIVMLRPVSASKV